MILTGKPWWRMFLTRRNSTNLTKIPSNLFKILKIIKSSLNYLSDVKKLTWQNFPRICFKFKFNGFFFAVPKFVSPHKNAKSTENPSVLFFADGNSDGKEQIHQNFRRVWTLLTDFSSKKTKWTKNLSGLPDSFFFVKSQNYGQYSI